jgi:hypothetical protein
LQTFQDYANLFDLIYDKLNKREKIRVNQYKVALQEYQKHPIVPKSSMDGEDFLRAASSFILKRSLQDSIG